MTNTEIQISNESKIMTNQKNTSDSLDFNDLLIFDLDLTDSFVF
jgi:hypothetical protein